MSIEANAWAQNVTMGHATSKLLLIAYGEFADPETWVCWPKKPRLARVAEISERHVYRLHNELVAAGWIEEAFGIELPIEDRARWELSPEGSRPRLWRVCGPGAQIMRPPADPPPPPSTTTRGQRILPNPVVFPTEHATYLADMFGLDDPAGVTPGSGGGDPRVTPGGVTPGSGGGDPGVNLGGDPGVTPDPRGQRGVTPGVRGGVTQGVTQEPLTEPLLNPQGPLTSLLTTDQLAALARSSRADLDPAVES